MTRLVNHIDHVQWVCHERNLAENAARLSQIFQCEIEGPVYRHDLGFILHVSWESGIEVIAPMTQVTDFNRQFHDYLERHGEGLQSIVFGVRDIEGHRRRVLEQGLGAGEIFAGDPHAPWADKLALKEFILDAPVMGTQLVFGEIEYREGVLSVE